jgi:hypothetical protein
MIGLPVLFGTVSGSNRCWIGRCYLVAYMRHLKPVWLNFCVHIHICVRSLVHITEGSILLDSNHISHIKPGSSTRAVVLFRQH